MSEIEASTTVNRRCCAPRRAASATSAVKGTKTFFTRKDTEITKVRTQSHFCKKGFCVLLSFVFFVTFVVHIVFVTFVANPRRPAQARRGCRLLFSTDKS
jgi:hypothetical protein